MNQIEPKNIEAPPLKKKLKSSGVIRISRAVAGYVVATLYDALLLEPSHARDFSYKKAGKRKSEKGEEPDIGSPRAAFYIGKTYDKKPWDNALEILSLTYGFQFEEERIYGVEFIKTCALVMKNHLEPDQRARFVTCTALSRLFNGPGDIAKAHRENEQSRFLRRYGFHPDQVEIVPMEKLEPNKEFFEHLEACIDETQMVDLEKSFGGEGCPALPEKPKVLDIARFLYWAMGQDNDLRERFEKMLPEKIRKKRTKSSIGYVIAELAARLVAILEGNELHGGVDRQSVYDTFIREIVKVRNPKGKIRYPCLKPLMDIFQGKPFETVHISSRENFFYQQWRQKMARARLMTAAFIFLWTWGAVKIIDRLYFYDPPQNTEFDPSAIVLPDLRFEQSE